ncbi:MAG: glycosyltransferase [Bacteroidia bacterium]|nr:glycosyltransferase [Bacteroidia bacterium]
MSKPSVFYLSPYDILRPRTNQLSDVRFTEGFAQNDCHAHLLVPFVLRSDNISGDAVYDTYGLKSSLHIHYLPTRFREDVHGKYQLLLVTWYAIRKVWQLLKKCEPEQPVYIISRSTHLLRPLFVLRKIFPKRFPKTYIVHWAHDFHHSRPHQLVYRKSDFILSTNSSILQDILIATGRKAEEGGITLNPITDAQAREFISKEKARLETGLNHTDKALVVYTGKLGKYYDKEIKFILAAAKKLPECQFLLTGGKPDVVQYWEDYCKGSGIENVIFTGYIHDYNRIKYYQYAADILLSYYTRQGHDVRYNLPNKLCEYMLSGNVIITPDYPATRDLLNDGNCIFTEAENSEALAHSIRNALNDPDLCRTKAEKASRDVRAITFKNVSAQLLKKFPK